MSASAIFRVRKRVKLALLALPDDAVAGKKALKVILDWIDEEIEVDAEREFLRPIKPTDPLTPDRWIGQRET